MRRIDNNMLKGRKFKEVLHELKPVILMVTVQITFAGVNVVYKLAAVDHFNLRVLVAYRFMFSAVFIVPVALYVERNKRPQLTWMVLFQAFLCGLFGGALAQNLYAEALALTSATFAAATSNLIPAITFIMALILGLEKLGWKTAAGKAKIFGTLMGIGGAMLLTFYKGLEINIWKSPIDLLTLVRRHSHHVTVADDHQHSGSRVLGSILALASVICYALWLIIQAKMAKRYPCPYSNTALMSVMGSLQGIVFALITERDWSQWKLGWNFRLFTVAYSGILASGVMFSFIAWCVQMRGPVFVSSFNPLMLVLVAIAGSLLLEEQLHLGSVLGAILIVCGLYMVLWGNGKEMKKMLQLVPEGASTPEEELSKSKRVEIDRISPLAENNTLISTNHNSRISISHDEAVPKDAAKDVRVNIVED